MRKSYYNILSFFAPLFRHLYRKRLRVLAYHTIENPKHFKRQLQFLKSKYSLISLVDLQDYLNKKKKLPVYPLLITFDDGDDSILKEGMPVLKEINCSAVLFVISELINTNMDFWWNTVAKNESQNGADHAEIQQKIKYLKQIPNKERLKEIDNYNAIFKTQLTTSQLECLDKNKIFIANHSHTHPMFNQCSAEEINYEMSRSKKLFLDWNVGEFEVFAYPNGNYDEASEKILKKNKIKLAFLFDHQINPAIINPLRISRIRVDAETELTEFEAKISGVHPFIYSMFK